MTLSDIAEMNYALPAINFDAHVTRRNYAVADRADIAAFVKRNFDFNNYEPNIFQEDVEGNVFDRSDFLCEVVRMALCERLTVIVIEHADFYSAHIEVPHQFLHDYGCCADAQHDVRLVLVFNTCDAAHAFALDMVRQAMHANAKPAPRA